MAARIQQSHVLAALWIALSAASLLLGYEFLRSVSQSLYIAHYGSKNLPYVMTLAPLGTLLAIYLYGYGLSLVGARRAIMYTALVSAALIMGCFYAISHGSRGASVVLYVVRESYIVLLVEQIWAFINSALRADDCRKLNGPICGVASLGAICGGLMVRQWVTAIGSANMLVFAAASLVPTGIFAVLAYRAGGEPQPSVAEAHGRQGHGGARILLQTPILRRLAVIILLTQVISTVLDLNLSRMVEATIASTDERTRWFSGFYMQINIWAAFGQFVATPFLLTMVPLRMIHIAIPLIHAAMGVLTLAMPSRTTAAAALTVFKVFDYSLFRGAKELLYVPLTYDARYRAKELIDAFGYRAAKGIVSAGLVLTSRVMTIPVITYGVAAVAAAVCWVGMAYPLGTPRNSDTST